MLLFVTEMHGNTQKDRALARRVFIFLLKVAWCVEKTYRETWLQIWAGLGCELGQVIETL